MADIMSFLSANDKLVTAWTAIAALLVSVISIIVAVANMTIQRAHNRKSVLPMGHISVGDYSNRISVHLRNDGVGPMIVRKATIVREGDNGRARSAIIEFMPEMPGGYPWTTFVGDISGRAVSAADSIALVLIEGDQRDDRFAAVKQMIRAALSNLSVRVEYTNIYGERMPSVVRSLDWFARPL
jgi:hypothetical protein